MEHGGELRAPTRLDVGRTPHHDLGQRKAAQHTAHHVAYALGVELAVGRCGALVRVELVGGFHAQQGLDTGHQRDGQCCGPDQPIVPAPQVRQRERIQAAYIIEGHEVFSSNEQCRNAIEDTGQHDADDHCQ